MMNERDEPTEKIIGGGGFWGLVMVCGLAIVATTGCFGNGDGTPSDKPLQESTAALPGATAGDPSALHRSFRAAFAEEARPYPNQGEDAREISDNLDSILVAVGDKRFAEALLRERPLIRSAVRNCMVEGDLERDYPRTYEVFQEAPQNEWPSDLAEEQATGTGPQGAPRAPKADDSQ
ncbi:MAG: hypothetical protein ABSE62_05165 [Chthoniobacteraceae bacterium]|jgi:hypothetical protein